MSPAREATLRELVRRRVSDAPVKSCPSSRHASGLGTVNQAAALALVRDGLAEEVEPPTGISRRFAVTSKGLQEWERLCAA